MDDLIKLCDKLENCSKKEICYKNEIVCTKAVLQSYINGDENNTMVSTLNIEIKGVSSEALMLATKQFCGVSNGSACNSSSYKPSYVLSAMGISEDSVSRTADAAQPAVDRHRLR